MVNTPLAVPAGAAIAKDVRGMSAEVVTTLAGIVAAVGVVAFNVGLERLLDLDLLGLTYAFVLPCGAFIGGIGAASGYYAAARFTQTLPSRRMLFEMLAIALSTWLLMHWVEYASLRLPSGRLVRDAIPFWDYLLIRTEHLRLTIQSAAGSAVDTTSELGLLGYAHELVQVAGFLLGGFVMWCVLRAHEACKPCSRYASTTLLLKRAPSTTFDDLLGRAGVVLPAFADHLAQVMGKRRLVGLNLSIATCPACHRSWIRPAAVVMDGAHAVAKPVAPYDLAPAQAAELHRLASS
jgi:hypothetical protein